MTLPNAINGVLAFALEIWMLWAYGECGWRVSTSPWTRWLLMLGSVSMAIALWAMWAAPKSPRRLRPPGLYVFKGCMFTGAAAALFAVGRESAAGVFFVLQLFHLSAAAHLRAEAAEPGRISRPPRADR